MHWQSSARSCASRPKIDVLAVCCKRCPTLNGKPKNKPPEVPKPQFRRLYVGNLPVGTPGMEALLTDFFNKTMTTAGLVTSPVVSFIYLPILGLNLGPSTL
jgi:hypothetical protein